MKKYKLTVQLLSIIFALVIIFFLAPITNVHADHTFDDGISNWSSYGSNPTAQFDKISMGKSGLSLGYSFGLAQNTSGKVPMGNNASDTSFLKDSISSGSNNTSFSKINEFLDDNGTYRNVLFQGQHNSATIAPQYVSYTSPDFMIVPADSTSKKIYSADYSILGVLASNNGNTGLKNKKYYVATMPNGTHAYKITGDFSRGGGSANNGTFNLQAEILLRPSPTNVAIVQRELYLYNPSNTTQQFKILFGEDTSMINGVSIQDTVPVFDLGDKRGIYIESNAYNNNDFKLYVTNQTDDGFTSYTGQAKSGTANWADAFSTQAVNGTGAEAQNNASGTQLSKFGDSAYTLKWDTTTLKPYQTSHYGSTFGVAVSPIAVPTADKTYTNETRSDGTNRVGDKLKFSLSMTNNGYKSHWSYQKLVDQIPNGLQIDANSIRQINDNGSVSIPSSSNYNDENKTLTIYPNVSLTDSQVTKITFEANITSDAPDAATDGNLTNTADFTGTDVGNGETAAKTFSATVKIPIQKPNYDFTFTKKVKNVTTGTDFDNSVDAHVGDIVDFFLEYKVTGKDSLNGGAHLSDKLPTGLVQQGKAYVKGPNDTKPYTSSNIDTDIIQVNPGQNVTVEFNAEVTSAAVGKVTNTATVTGGVSSSGEKPGDMVSNGATVNVLKSDSITSIPSLIDFGSVNMYGTKKTLDNVKTTGELTVSHPTNNNFNVYVSYDNDNNDTKMTNSNGDTLPANDSGLIFIKQRKQSATDTGTWQPISPQGTAIRDQSFTGNTTFQNLSDYIGVGDWQLKLAPDTVPGAYNGKLTWTMVDDITTS